jgi:hypothetical protein
MRQRTREGLRPSFAPRVHIKDDIRRPDRERRDQRAFDDLVGRLDQKKAVLERSRLIFVSVADDPLPGASFRGDGRPFPMSWKTSAPEAAKAGRFDARDDARRRRERRFQSSASACGEIGGQVRSNLQALVC